MGIDIINLIRPQTRIVDCHLHAVNGPFAFGIRSRYMIGIPAQTIAHHLRIDIGPPFKGLIKFFQNEHARTLPHHKTVAVQVKGA